MLACKELLESVYTVTFLSTKGYGKDEDRNFFLRLCSNRSRKSRTLIIELIQQYPIHFLPMKKQDPFCVNLAKIRRKSWEICGLNTTHNFLLYYHFML